ncbi:MAG TPA: polynucleotide kinase-phosphatase [Dongiaceae bacterium]
MLIKLPEYCLVLMVGITGSGKSTFAARHFKPTEVLSSDRFRGMVADDETDQGVTGDAFELLNAVVEKRLKHRKLTVVDATNVQFASRKSLIALARRWHAFTFAIVIDTPPSLAAARNRDRPDRQFGAHVVQKQHSDLRRSLRGLHREGLRQFYVLESQEEIDAATIERTKLWVDKRELSGPFDIIGDVHGCATELEELLARLGYGVSWQDKGPIVTPPDGRKVIFVGDLVDRGPRSPDVLRLAMSMVEAGSALCVIGNHDDKLKRKLSGRDVKISHGLQETLDQLAVEPEPFVRKVHGWIDGLVSHYMLDGGSLVVAHAGLKEELQGRTSGAVRGFAMYGETTGEVDEYGLPVRWNWAAEYKGKAKVVYGHTPVPEARWLNGTICIDTACVFGGSLTALRYPELELVSVPAKRMYYEPIKPIQGPAAKPASGQLNLADVIGKQVIETRVGHPVVIQEEQAAAALEVMSRFAIDPRWLIHLPPTMSPAETSAFDGWLERPEEALAYYADQGVEQVVAEEKHMGSRALVVLARDEKAARLRFHVERGRGAIYTRTGRPFLHDRALEAAILQRIDTAAQVAGLWSELASDWLLFDCELMPWSAKAQQLIREQYAPVGAAAIETLMRTRGLLAMALARDADVGALAARTDLHLDHARRYRTAYGRYMWPCNGIDDLRIAPFHLLASEGAVHADKTNQWHMERAHRLAAADPKLLVATDYLTVALDDPEQVADCIAWWLKKTEAGAEGMVVKPLQFIARGKHGLLQPAIKCRGREYLRIIYGANYDAPENLDRLKKRGLGRKRSMASREFALGLEALYRFVEFAPATHVHQAVFGVLALESEPVDPCL